MVASLSAVQRDIALCAIGSMLMSPGICLAQTKAAPDGYPNKPIRLVIPSAVGGGNDVLARLMGPYMTETFGRQIVADNRPGAGGIVGSETVAKANPDGYTLLIVAGGYMLNPSLYAKLPYDSINAFERIAMLACAPNMMVVHASVPAKTVQDLIALAKAKPKSLAYASSGIGTTSFLSAEVFKHMAGLDMVHVPYAAGASAASTAVVAGQVQFVISAPNFLLPHVQSGRVRALGVTSAKRLAAAPQIPTIAESGLPGYEVDNCYGMLAPAKTPKPIVDKLNTELVRVLRLPDVKTKLEAMGFNVIASTAAQYDAIVRSEIPKWTKVMKELGLEPG